MRELQQNSITPVQNQCFSHYIMHPTLHDEARRPLGSGIKNITHQHGFEHTTSCLSDRLELSNKVEVWQNLKKKRNTDYDFPPPLYKSNYY